MPFYERFNNMKVLHLILSNGLSISHDLGKEISDGADGQVFELFSDPEKVIKYSVHYEYGNTIKVEHDRIGTVLFYLGNTQPSACARVFSYGELIKSKRTTIHGDQRYFIYYYIMEKCFSLSEDEKKVFHSILSHEDRGYKKDYSIAKISDMIKGLSIGLDFDCDNVLKFCHQLNECEIKQNDLHVRNIMKNKNGDYVLIDFDRCELK